MPMKQFARMIDTTWPIGIMQHSNGEKPDENHGSSIDDNSRALIAEVNEIGLQTPGTFKTYLQFILDARRGNGLYHNYKNHKGEWVLDAPTSKDCFARATWALAEFAVSKKEGLEKREIAEQRFLENLPVAEQMDSPTSKAITLIGISKYLGAKSNQDVMTAGNKLADRLMDKFIEFQDSDWVWPYDKATFCVGRIPQSLILAGKVLGRKELTSKGLEALDFLIRYTFENSTFVPIGNKGWLEKGGKPARYDQQTVEAGAMTEACVEAFQATLDKKYLERARQAFSWFTGNNTGGYNMLALDGGVYDAITENRINKNQGAESVLSYLLANIKLRSISK